MHVSGQFVDIFNRRIYPADIQIENGTISAINEIATAPDRYIMPGFVDAHIHIESSMLVPSAFAGLAVLHGTVATVSDPHEIANVCGVEGVRYMVENSKTIPFKFFFGAPSCVPATGFETAGASLNADTVADLLADKDIWYLSEMMNYPGVLYNDPEVMAKIKAAQKLGKPVDGHAPGLRGDTAAAYASAGISTDHECFSLEEALEKIALGMHILIREGSAAKNYEALCELLRLHPERVMFCSDDKHPDELVVNHINSLVSRSLAKGYDLYDVLQAACVNPVLHYKLPVGLLRIGEPADFIVVENLSGLKILETWIDGKPEAINGVAQFGDVPVPVINNFNTNTRKRSDFAVKADKNDCLIRVIEAIEGQLITNCIELPAKVVDGEVVSDTTRDILKIVVVNRYQPYLPVSVGFIKNIGIKKGAMASTVGHDCHNIIAVGVDDKSICDAVNALIAVKGGISVVEDENNISCMPLPVGGLMSDKDGWQTTKDYTEIDRKAKELGTPLKAPFMTLSFMALLVIPSLKLSDKGLFDGSTFRFTDLIVDN